MGHQHDHDHHHDETAAAAREPGAPVRWYRPRISREDMSALNRKTDLQGFIQAGGYLLILAITGSVSFYCFYHAPWYVTVLALYLHGACWSFMINAFHELVHESVFKTRGLNLFFLRITSFLGWYNHHQFWASHTEHHKFTLHPPDDLEVVLPVKDLLKGVVKVSIIDFWGAHYSVKTTIRMAFGKIDGEWNNQLFPPEKMKERRELFRWSQIVLIGHVVIAGSAIALGYWPMVIIFTCGRFYGGGIEWLCNNTQHAGLADNVPDFRLCCRTIYLNPVFRFLYWHMNYHTEHHMYAGVPCYNLHRLHKLIRHEMPECPNGLIPAWVQIARIAKRQMAEPGYQYEPVLPRAAA